MLRLGPVSAVVLLLTLPEASATAAGRRIHSFVHDRARAHRTVDGHRVFVPARPESKAFRTPRTKGTDYSLPTPAIAAVHVRYVPTGGRVDVRATLDDGVNVPFAALGKPTEPGTITGVLGEPLPAGEHRIRLRVRGATAAWVALGPKTPPALGGMLPPLLRNVDAAPTLVVPAGGTVAWYILLPEGAHLALSAAAGGDVPRTLTVRVTTGRSSGGEEVLRRELTGALPVPLQADLSRFAGRPLRLEFAVTGPSGEPATLVDPHLVLPGVEAEPKRPARTAKSAVVWLVDTLRTDRLKAHAAKTRVEAPTLHRLAREGGLFEACTAQGNESLASHATLFTSQYPVTHRVTSPKARLSHKTPLLGEAARRAGLKTAAYISNGYVSKKWGFHRGFTAYRNFIREERPSYAGVVFKHARKYLDGLKDGTRFFLYLGTIDPHVAYNAPKPYKLMYWGDRKYKGRLKPQGTGVFLDRWKAKGRRPPLSDADKEYLVALYDGEVTYNDHVLGQLVEHLVQTGRSEDTVLLVTSDHGEEFFEHGGVGHGHTVREVVTHVPLLVWWPGVLPAGRRVSEDVELTDVMPTLLELLGADVPKTAQGESLVPLLTDTAPAMPRPAFSFHGGVRSAKIGHWKYVLLSRAEKVYDLRKDPDEHTDVADKHPLALRLLREALTVHRVANLEWRKSEDGHSISPTASGARRLLAE